jgi:hypothetical protein
VADAVGSKPFKHKERTPFAPLLLHDGTALGSRAGHFNVVIQEEHFLWASGRGTELKSPCSFSALCNKCLSFSTAAIAPTAIIPGPSIETPLAIRGQPLPVHLERWTSRRRSSPAIPWLGLPI